MSAFLHSTNRYPVDIQHISGKQKLNIAADYLSRNPAKCESQHCQICKFIHEDSQCTIANTEIEYLPVGNKIAWSQLQQQDEACSQAYQRLKSGQQPAKHGRYSNDIRKYFNTCQAKDLLVVKDTIPNTTQIKWRIVVPKDFIPAVLAHIHQNQQHPSKYQMEKTFNRYYFGINTKLFIDEIVDQCVFCKANKIIPKTQPEYKPISNPDHPGIIFNADVMVRHRQKILVCRDIFSTYTTAIFIQSEKAEHLKNAIIESITPIRSNQPVMIRTDSASGFKALMKDQQLQQLNIMIQPTDPSNKNSVATVDNAIKELEQEIIKQAPHSSEINQYLLSACVQSLNNKIRNRGLSAHEIMFSREQNTGKNLTLSDNNLLKQQLKTKQINNLQSAKHISEKNKPAEILTTGDIVAIDKEKSKHNSRDIYLITKEHNQTVELNKIIRYQQPTSKIQNKTRIVSKTAVFKVDNKNQINKASKTTIPTKEPKTINIPIESEWSPYSLENSDDDSDIEIIKTVEDNNIIDNDFIPYPEHHTANEEPTHNSSDEDKIESEIEKTIETIRTLQTWERHQNDHAKSTARKSSTRHLIDDLDASFTQHRTTVGDGDENSENDDQWDHGFDIDSPTNSENIDDDIFFEAMLSPMNQVQDVNKLYKQAIDKAQAVNTNIPQRLDDVLPIPTVPTLTYNKKRVSPPRKDLPIESEEREAETEQRELRSGIVTYKKISKDKRKK